MLLNIIILHIIISFILMIRCFLYNIYIMKQFYEYNKIYRNVNNYSIPTKI